MSIEAMTQALEALIWTTGSGDFGEGGQAREGALKCLFPAITALRQAIEEAEKQEPVSALTNLRVPIERINEIQGQLMAYYSSGAQAPKDLLFDASDCIGALAFDLIDAKYAAQPEWIGLTDEEIEQGHKESWVDKQAFESAVWWAEAKLKEKNT